ncbi:hypothetical protein GCM10027614_41630 [Micromonospora vulcania]
MDVLVEWIFLGQLLQLRHELRVLAERQPGVGQCPDRDEPQVFQAFGLLVQPVQAGDVDQ